jgi:HK97 family phage prohead protease
MPYYITDKQADCIGWATIKVVDNQAETITCHGDNKQAAIDHMVALSMSEGMKPLGEYFRHGTMNSNVLICDIDDTIMHNGQLIPDVVHFVESQEMGIMLVTGRLEADRAKTVQQLQDLGMDYDDLFMNDLGSSARSVEFKKAMAEKLLAAYDVHLAVDNDAGARQAYDSLGIPVIDPAHLPKQRSSKLESKTFSRKPNMNKRDLQEPISQELLEPTKADLAAALRDLLGDVVVFKFQAHGFHWNVRGINFQQYHEFFGEIYEDADGSIDPIAENIRKLNFDAPFKLTDFMESAPENEPTDSSDPLEMCRSLYIANEDVRECIVKALSIADELEEQGIVNFLAERQDQHSKWQWQLRAIVGDSFAKQYEIDVEEVSEGLLTGQGNENPTEPSTEDQGNPASAMTNPDGTPMMQMNSTDSKWARAAQMILRKLEPAQEIESRNNKIETRVNHVDFEMRASADGMTFEGYASVFNSASEPINGRFTEYVAPGAFKRSLQARNDVKLLWNHDTGQVLGSTRAGTLKLVEDNTGLKAIATLPDTQLGRDAATLIKRGDVANMSFGFTVPAGGDSWNQDGSVRTLNSVKLHEVSIVSFPAYQSTTVSVRSGINPDDLAEALMRLENGEEMTADQGNLITDVVTRLTKTIEDVPTSLLDLKKKQLDLLAKVM